MFSKHSKKVGKWAGFTIPELLIAMVIAALTMQSVAFMTKALLDLSRRSVSETHNQGISSTVVGLLEEDISSAFPTLTKAANEAVWGGIYGLRFVRKGKDFDGDGQFDLICLQWSAPVASATPSTVQQGYLARAQFANATVIGKTGSSNDTAGCNLLVTDARYIRLTPPESSLARIEFGYCRPDNNKGTHNLVCYDWTDDVKDRCGVYNPRILWMITLNLLTTRKVRATGSDSYKKDGNGIPQITYKTLAMRLTGHFKEGLVDAGQPSTCSGTHGMGIDESTKNGCPDAFDVLGRLCSCNCTKNGIDDDGDTRTDEECQIGKDNDGDGTAATTLNNCE